MLLMFLLYFLFSIRFFLHRTHVTTEICKYVYIVVREEKLRFV